MNVAIPTKALHKTWTKSSTRFNQNCAHHNQRNLFSDTQIVGNYCWKWLSRAYVEKPNEELEVIDLYDNGVNADTSAGDGIYSRFFTNVTYPGRYSVKCQVWDDGSAYVSYGFIGSSIFVSDGPYVAHLFSCIIFHLPNCFKLNSWINFFFLK